MTATNDARHNIEHLDVVDEILDALDAREADPVEERRRHFRAALTAAAGSADLPKHVVLDELHRVIRFVHAQNGSP
jgi:hypothetical protein